MTILKRAKGSSFEDQDDGPSVVLPAAKKADNRPAVLRRLHMRMRVAIWASGLLSVGIVLAAVFGDVRVIVVQPIGAIPNGMTAIVAGVPQSRIIDTPDAICMRIQGSVNMMCRGLTTLAIARNGTVLLRLPYSSALFHMVTPDYSPIL